MICIENITELSQSCLLEKNIPFKNDESHFEIKNKIQMRNKIQILARGITLGGKTT